MTESCDRFRDIVWDIGPDFYGNDEAQQHMASCPACREEYQEVSELQRHLSNPSAINIESVKAKVFGAIEQEPKHKRKRFRRWMGPMAAAATIFFAIFSLFPSTTSAVRLDDLFGRHIKCETGEMHKGFSCVTHMQLAEKMAAELGLDSVPVDDVGVRFVGGEICKLGDRLAAHAVYETDNGLVSRFEVNDPNGDLVRAEGVTSTGADTWGATSGNHKMTIQKLTQNHYSIVISSDSVETSLSTGSHRQ